MNEYQTISKIRRYIDDMLFFFHEFDKDEDRDVINYLASDINANIRILDVEIANNVLNEKYLKELNAYIIKVKKEISSYIVKDKE